ncbi:MAG TPA: META domain-containing protein [Methanoregulaceae archaeon]|nr:META domain-containing protein [Methanoregulaceae archaeon]HPJ73695.1 META domain-containing protein [Methanoregulaceae archaeon]HPQ75835.1 META domain-containing protein [Methanoregulaceae archaeon]HRX33435.1 META domain-containing protein [Methanoregulaceae archaeon]
MRYRSTLFSIFSYLLVLFVAISLIGSVQALTIPDGQRGSFQSGKIQGVLGFDPVTAPENCGMFSGEARNSGFFAHPRLQAKSDILPPVGPFNRQLQISDIHPSVGTGTRSQLVDSIIQNRMNRNSNQDAGHSSLMPFSGMGTVTYIDLEGGFYGIITDEGAQLRPTSLPAEFRVDGQRVRFTAQTVGEQAGIFMWGRPVKLIDIQPVTESITGTGTVTYIELEGGFFGIITESGERYLPLNLPDEYALEGLFVDFTARIAEESATIAMWGTPVHLLSIALSGGGDAGAKFGIAGSWVCTGYRDGTGMRTPLPGTGIVADFGTDGRVTGTSGCNLFFAEYEADERSLDIGAAGMTMMYCLEPVGVMDQEQIFLNLLCSAETFDISDGQLTIQDATGQSILTFEKA